MSTYKLIRVRITGAPPASQIGSIFRESRGPARLRGERLLLALRLGAFRMTRHARTPSLALMILSLAGCAGSTSGNDRQAVGDASRGGTGGAGGPAPRRAGGRGGARPGACAGCNSWGRSVASGGAGAS